MRKVVLISGAVTAVLLIFLLTGMAGRDDTIKASMRRGNSQYAAGDYKKSLASYEKGLAKDSKNKMLNFNAAQSAYLSFEYEKAAEYYEKSADSTDKFLNWGNIFFRSGDAIGSILAEQAENPETAAASPETEGLDVNQQLQTYASALKIYQDGMIKFPQNVPLKYNFESVKQKIDELIENMDPQEGEQGESQENSEGSEGEEQESSQSGEEGFEGEEQEASQAGEDSEEGEEQEASQAGEENEESEDNEEAMNMQEVERILQILESQEQESLKNNQEIKESVGGKEGKYAW